MPTKAIMSDHIFIKSAERSLKISPSDILYIKASGSYLNVKTKGNEFSMSQNLTKFMSKNELPSLVRVHRSFIVNLDAVDSFDKESLYIGKARIPIGENYKKDFMKHIQFL